MGGFNFTIGGYPGGTPPYIGGGAGTSDPGAGTSGQAGSGSGGFLSFLSSPLFRNLFGVGSSILGSALGYNAAGNASDAQAQAANNAALLQSQSAQNALAFQNQVFNTQQNNAAPWLNVGRSGLANLANLLGILPHNAGTAAMGNTAASSPAAAMPSNPPYAINPNQNGGGGSGAPNASYGDRGGGGILNDLSGNGFSFWHGQDIPRANRAPDAGPAIATPEVQPGPRFKEPDPGPAPNPNPASPAGGGNLNDLNTQLQNAYANNLQNTDPAAYAALLAQVQAAGGNTVAGGSTAATPSDGSPSSSVPVSPDNSLQSLVNPSLGATGSLAQGFGEEFNAPTSATEQNDPGYQFRLQQGMDALQHSAAARGDLLSGGTARALNQFGQDYASNEYGNVYNRAFGEYQNRYNVFNNNQTNLYNRLASMAGIGQVANNQLAQSGQQAANNVGNILNTSAGQIGQNYNNVGAARGSGYVGQANAIQGGLDNFGQYLQLFNQMNGGH